MSEFISGGMPGQPPIEGIFPEVNFGGQSSAPDQNNNGYLPPYAWGGGGSGDSMTEEEIERLARKGVDERLELNRQAEQARRAQAMREYERRKEEYPKQMEQYRRMMDEYKRRRKLGEIVYKPTKPRKPEEPKF